MPFNALGLAPASGGENGDYIRYLGRNAMASDVIAPPGRPNGPAEGSVRVPLGAPRFPRLTICSLALAVPGLLLVACLVIAAFAVEWGAVNERGMDALVVVLLSLLALFPMGALLAVVSLFLRRQSWRSSLSALALHLLGLAILCVSAYVIVSALAAAAVNAVQATLSDLMAMLTMLSGS